MTLSILKVLATYRLPSLFMAKSVEPNIAQLKDNTMTNESDNWHQLARYDTNIQGELHANLLRNNGVTVSLQPLSAIPGMNSGIVLWVEKTDLAQAQQILQSVNNDGADGASLLAQMSDAELGISNDTSSNQAISDGSTMNKGGTL